MPRNDEQDPLMMDPDGHQRSLQFAQQGTVDWVDLYKTTVRTSIGILSRLSAAGVDPFTVVVGQAIASQFRLSTLGYHRLDSAVKDLPLVAGFGDAVWFGVGIKHIIRTLAQSTEGCCCLMLCSALAETHSSDISAKVLLRLAEESTGAGKAGLTPSLSQWHSLVKTCSGILAHTSFGVVTEQMMSLADEDRVDQNWPRKYGDPADMAKALRGLGEVSRNAAFAMTITGTAECGWLAAVAHWFFELDVEIRNDRGDTIYSCCREDQEPRVLIIYTLQSSNHTQMIGKTYLIKSIEDRLRSPNKDAGVISGRVEWETALQQTFGRSARRLLEQPTIFGRAIGSAARIFQAIACKEDKTEFTERVFKNNYFYGDQTYGRGFLSIATLRLPELSQLAQKGEPLLETSLSDAIGEYQVCMAKLASVCSCEICAGEEDSSHRRKGKRKHESKSMVAFCLPVLAQNIIRLLRELTLMDFDEKLRPSRYGLESYYLQHAALYSSCLDEDLQIGVDDRYIQTLLARDSPEGLLQDARTIFAGAYSIGGLDSPAIVVRGLCFYLGILREISSDIETLIRVHIVPGHIESSTGRTFDVVQVDSSMRVVPTISYEAEKPVAARQIKASKGRCSPGLDARLVIEEDVESLKMYYRISAARDNMLCTFVPQQLIEKVLSASGRVECKKIRCREISDQKIGAAIVEGEGRLNVLELSQQGYSVVLRQVAGNPLARCMALFMNVQYSKDENPLTGNSSRAELMSLPRGAIFTMDPTNRVGIVLQNDECFPCCIRAALKLQGDHEVVCVIQR